MHLRLTVIRLLVVGFLALGAVNADYVFTSGQNAFGQLGISSSGPQVNSFTAITTTGDFAYDATNKLSTNFATAGGILGFSGHVYVWGAFGGPSQLAHLNSSQPLRLPLTTANLKPLNGSVESIAVGGAFNVTAWITVTTSTGQAYSMGGGEFGQHCSSLYGSVAIASSWAAAVTTNPIRAAGGFRSVAAGAAHTLLVTNTGSVYGCGRNNRGQLGDTTTGDRPSPSLVLFAETIAQVYAGGYHSAAVSSTGKLYLWGDNSYGQLKPATLLALVASPVLIYTPQQAPNDFGFANLGEYSTYFGTSLGSNYSSYGPNEFGQLGHDNSTDAVDRAAACFAGPAMFQMLYPCQGYSFMKTADKSYCVVGNCRSGACGTAAQEVFTLPTVVDDTGVLAGLELGSVACGAEWTVLMSAPEPWINPANPRALLPAANTLTIEGANFYQYNSSNPDPPILDVALAPSSLTCTLTSVNTTKLVCQLGGTLTPNTYISAVVTNGGLNSYDVNVAFVLGNPPSLETSQASVYETALFVDILGSSFPPSGLDVSITLSPTGTCSSVSILNNSTTLRCFFGEQPSQGLLTATVTTPAGTSEPTTVALIVGAPALPPKLASPGTTTPSASSSLLITCSSLLLIVLAAMLSI